MIINYNSTAANTYNSLTRNTNAATKSIQQLSSGKRINSAGDDPAGSAITTLMTNQINGLKQAKLNASTGNDLLQTAADALGNIKNILAEMKTKATQAASDSNTAADRTKLQAQVDSLAQGITDITNTTEFNTQNLLAGGLSDTFHVGANANQNVKVSISAMDAFSLGVATYLTAATGVANAATVGVNLSSLGRGLDANSTNGYQIVVKHVAATTGDSVTSVVKTDKNQVNSLQLSGVSGFTGTVDTTFKVKVASVSNSVTAGAGSSYVKSIVYSTDGGSSWQTASGDFNLGVNVAGVTLTLTAANVATSSGFYTKEDEWDFSINASKNTLQLKGTNAAGATFNIGSAVDVHKGDTSVMIGDATQGKSVDLGFDYAKMTDGAVTFSLKHIESAAAAVVNGKVTTNAQVAAGINISSQADANRAVAAIDKATSKVSEQYAQIGAYQDRLAYTQDNLTTESTNLSTAQSSIQNVDIAEATTEYQKNNILQQAATSMLAKANQLPQTALQLLQG